MKTQTILLIVGFALIGYYFLIYKKSADQNAETLVSLQQQITTLVNQLNVAIRQQDFVTVQKLQAQIKTLQDQFSMLQKGAG